MSSNFGNTEPGGEQTQYEAAHEDAKPRARESGQLGANLEPTKDATSVKNTQDPERKAENMRFGQAMSEEGVGGMTAPSRNDGHATNDGGFGDGKPDERDRQPGQSRMQSGYDAGNEMDRKLGG